MSLPSSEGPVGFDSNAYGERDAGLSPDLVRQATLELVRSRVKGRILDAGSGSGSWLRLLLDHCPGVTHVTSVDLVDSGASKIRNVDFHLRDLSRDSLPAEAASTDWVFAIEVLEHLANPRAFLGEVRRILKPGGRFFITTPNNDSLTSRLSLLFRGYYPAFCDHDYKGSGHITPILKIDLERMADEAGFSRVEFAFPLDGRIPKSDVPWQRFFPRLRGSLWS
ncbi:MAG TPA: class I SAM-dependent methyltransferase, partial [Polyangiaceae bacterium]